MEPLPTLASSDSHAPGVQPAASYDPTRGIHAVDDDNPVADEGHPGLLRTISPSPKSSQPAPNNRPRLKADQTNKFVFPLGPGSSASFFSPLGPGSSACEWHRDGGDNHNAGRASGRMLLHTTFDLPNSA